MNSGKTFSTKKDSISNEQQQQQQFESSALANQSSEQGVPRKIAAD